jgi:hypothetical protein
LERLVQAIRTVAAGDERVGELAKTVLIGRLTGHIPPIDVAPLLDRERSDRFLTSHRLTVIH